LEAQKKYVSKEFKILEVEIRNELDQLNRTVAQNREHFSKLIDEFEVTHAADIEKLRITDEAQSSHFYSTLVQSEIRITSQVSYLQKSLLYEERNLNVSSVTIDRVSQFYPSKE